MSSKTEFFTDLSLEIPPEKNGAAAAAAGGSPVGTTLGGCLHHFGRLERLSASCGACKKAQPCTKQMSLQRLPPVLCMHLKRFQHLLGPESRKARTPTHAATHTHPLSRSSLSAPLETMQGVIPPGFVPLLLSF